MTMRACSMTWNIWRMPSCTPPTRVPTAGCSPPKVISQVVEAFRPILCSTLVTRTPLRSPSEPSALTRNLGTRNMDSPLVAGQHQVEDVLGHVLLTTGDEPLDPLDVPGAVGLLDRLGPAGAHVRAGVRLGQHHGRAPLALDGLHRELLLLGGADVPQQVGEGRAAGVHPDGRGG